jgi:hypothetical protein
MAGSIRWMEYWSDDFDFRPDKDGVDDPGPIRGKNAMRKHGKIIRWQPFHTHAAALEAGGLSE